MNEHLENEYLPQELEAKWQQRWAESGIDHSNIDCSAPPRPKHYALTMLPYPSGDLHMGHWYAMAPSDARARFMRMRGYNVLFPMGFDAFGLPAENAAIKRNIHPKEWTYANIERMRGQLRSMGSMIDWSTTAGRSGFSSSCSSSTSPTAKARQSIGARAATRRSRANRSGAKTATASDARRRSHAKSSLSGSSA
jgi:valyl-tRNA synthetase